MTAICKVGLAVVVVGKYPVVSVCKYVSTIIRYLIMINMYIGRNDHDALYIYVYIPAAPSKKFTLPI